MAFTVGVIVNVTIDSIVGKNHPPADFGLPWSLSP
jgi:hypothetical protein